jgi:ABC-2 type transport system permease protein
MLPVILAGDVLSAFLFGLLISLVPIAVSIVIAPTAIASPALLAGGVALSALCFAILGAVFSVPPTDNPANIMALANLIRLPLIFISGVFVPIAGMASWGRTLAAFSPLTYSTELIRTALGQSTEFSATRSAVMLVVFCILLWMLAVRGHKRSISRRL